MKILHISPAYVPAWRYGGPVFSIHNLCKSLVRLGHDIQVLTTNLNGAQYLDVPMGKNIDVDGVAVTYFKSFYPHNLAYSPALGQAFSNALITADCAHIHTVFCWPAWIAATIARKKNKPYIISPRGMLIPEMIKKKSMVKKYIWLYALERRNLKCAAALHFTSSSEMDMTYKNFLALPSGFVIPNALDQSLETAAKSDVNNAAPSNAPSRIVCMSRINWKKGIDRVIKAMQFIDNADLLIAGNDEENYMSVLKKIAATHKVSARVAFLGPVYDSEKIRLLRNADLFVLASHSENFGNAVLEAMALGCPVIVTPEVALSEIISRENAGLVVSGDPEILARSINLLLKNPALKNQLAANGKKFALKHFDTLEIARMMEKQYLRATKQ